MQAPDHAKLADEQMRDLYYRVTAHLGNNTGPSINDLKIMFDAAAAHAYKAGVVDTEARIFGRPWADSWELAAVLAAAKEVWNFANGVDGSILDNRFSKALAILETKYPVVKDNANQNDSREDASHVEKC